MHRLLISTLVLSSIFVVYGDENFKEIPTQCDYAQEDVNNKCKAAVTDCKSLQDYIVCARDVMHKECGRYKANEFCDRINSQFGRSITSCEIHCPFTNISCSDVTEKITKKCGPQPRECKEGQKFINCVRDVTREACGNTRAKAYCESVNKMVGGSLTACNIWCHETEEQNNFASSIMISGNIGALLVYKMVLENFFSNF